MCGVKCQIFMEGNCDVVYEDPAAFVKKVDHLIEITEYYPDLFKDQVVEIFEEIKKHNP